jgi:hypothetical protein
VSVPRPLARIRGSAVSTALSSLLPRLFRDARSCADPWTDLRGLPFRDSTEHNNDWKNTKSL